MGYDPFYGEAVYSPEDQARIDALRQWDQEQREAAHLAEIEARYEEQVAAEEQYRHDTQSADLMSQVDAVQRQLGRVLTGKELRALAPEIAEQVNAEREPNVYDAIGQIQAEGQSWADLGTRQGRVEHMLNLAEDAKREQAGVDLLGPPAASSEAYDLNDRDDRVAWMTDKMAGADVDGREYRSGSEEAPPEAAMTEGGEA